MHPSDFRITDTARSMQHIINLVSRGMTRWTGGTIPFEKAEHLVAKLDKKYEVLANQERHRTLRKNKRARCRLVMGIDGAVENKRLWWVLLVTKDGVGAVTEQETLWDVTDKRHRIEVMGYELVRYPKPRERDSKEGQDKTTWTWRVPAVRWREHREHLIALARHKSPRQAQKAVYAEMKRPGFRGLREQRLELFHAMRGARVGIVANGAESILFPEKIPYLRMQRQGREESISIQDLHLLRRLSAEVLSG